LNGSPDVDIDEADGGGGGNRDLVSLFSINLEFVDRK
jgi:hypothetical protein